MQQRRVRLGDILDDYCPRERRITNHAVVAMIEDTVKQTRCTTCDADHEYRDGKAPSPRKRKAAVGDGVLVTGRSRPVLAAAEPELELSDEPVAVGTLDEQPEASELDDAPVASAMADSDHEGEVEPDPDADSEPAVSDRDEWPVHRPLIRATLPRPEGQVPERKAPDFTFRPAGGRFDTPRNGQRKGGGGPRPARQAQGQPGQGQGRFGGGGPRNGSGNGSRQGAGQGPGQGQGHAQAQRHGNRAGVGGNRPAQSRGPRPGGGSRKRGR